MLFARAGYRVLLVDRVRFPKDTLSTHYIHQPGVARLARWGVLDAVVATGCPPIDRLSYEYGDLRLEGCSLPVEGFRAGYAPRRFLLDQVLADAAVAAGAEFRPGCGVEDVVLDADGRVVGVRCGGSEERARLVVGADGMRSGIAARVGAGMVREDPTLTCAYYSYWQDTPAHFELYEAAGRWVGAIPTNDGLTLVGAYFPQAEFDRVRGDAQTAYLETIRTTAPDLYERVRSGLQVERLYGTGEQRNFFREAAGPGWALVGDSSHHKDSITARGMMDAFLQAELLVDAVGQDLHDEAKLTRALRRYDDDREDQLIDGYRSTLTVAALATPAEHISMLRAIAGRQDLVDGYFATLSGARDVEDFYTEELLEQLSIG
jgi:flavin-dependent dehydrogenase